MVRIRKENLVIRPAKPSEAEALTALARRSKAAWGYSAEFMRACEDELTYTPDQIRSPGARFAIAEISGNCVGFYALLRTDLDDAELEALFVEPGHMGNGYGRELVKHALRSAAGVGCTRLVIQGDPNANTFYLSVGGILVGERESGSIPGRFLPVYAINVPG